MRKIDWRRRWQDTSGLGEIVGGIGALLLLVFVLTGGISAFRLWQTHQVLDRATSIALRSEEQQGCWTPATSRAVSTTLQQGGLVPSGITVTAYTGQQANYGAPIVAGLRYRTATDFLFGGLGQWTEQAAQAGSSFYVAANANATGSGCGTPTLGTVALGSGSTTPVATVAPTITGVQFSQWTATGATLTISGSDLGSLSTLTTAAGGGQDSPNFTLGYQGQTIGHTANSWGLNYVSWSASQIVVRYPGSWTVANSSGNRTLPLNGGSLTVTVDAHGTTASEMVTVPTSPAPSGLTLSANATNPDTGQPVTLTATTQGVTGSQSINIVNTTTGQVVASCADTNQCSVPVTQYTQNSAVTDQFTANIGSAGAASGSVTANTLSMTWNPVATITASRWWLAPSNTPVGIHGLTLPAGDPRSLWWRYAVSGASSTFQGWSQNWDSPVTARATFTPAATEGWLGLQDLTAGTHRVDLTFYFSNGAIQELTSPPITIVTPHLSLSASATAPRIGSATTLTAVSNIDLTGTGLGLSIEDTNSSVPSVVASCTTGTTCTASVSNDGGIGLTQHYVAVLGPPQTVGTGANATGVVATSASIAVTWHWHITLSASTAAPAPGDTVVLTVSAGANVGSNFLNIVDTTTGQVVGSCSYTTSCSVNVTQYQATTQTFQANVGQFTQGVPYAISPTISVTWAYTLSLSANTTSTNPYQSVLLTAQSNAPSYQAYINIVDTTTGQVVQSCWWSSGCSVWVSQSQITTQNYQADIGSWQEPPAQATSVSNRVAVTWQYSVTLNASPTQVAAGNATTLTATASGYVFNYSINIVDTTTGQVVGSCWYTTSCTVTVTHYAAQTDTFEADVGSYDQAPSSATSVSSPVSVTWSALTVTLAASNVTPSAGNNVTLTATTNGNVGSHYINIVDTTTGQVVNWCWSGNSCAVNVSNNQATTQTYQADVGASWNTTPSQAIAASSAVTVTWQQPWSVSLTASSPNPALGSTVTLTATASQSLNGTPYYLNIVDTTTGQVLTSVGFGSSGSVTVSYNAATSQTYEADIGGFNAWPHQSTQAISGSVTVTWGYNPDNYLLPAGGAPVDLYAVLNGYDYPYALNVPAGTAVTIMGNPYNYVPYQYLMSLVSGSTSPVWDGVTSYGWQVFSQTVTGPNDIVGQNTGAGIGTAYFQTWDGQGQSGGSNIVSVTWY